MEILAYGFVVAPCFGVVLFTCFAACRALEHRAFKVLTAGFFLLGLVCLLVPVLVAVWLAQLMA
ncbi:hypothetical protein [Streptacidiphilus jiangxiensis]|uniref:Uncharacterized protein n=1 Tax=Streptacidiphilus jiangxiensis TaxID=235985 RepID=A0A1H7TNZ9_STRJI|nr:hypothetical protein [Streptacidiphilus jiangxiensis]SEL86275.1 hypothetical protein SAMN05414137_114105 [Streptacidiphilus jiangxiensis]